MLSALRSWQGTVNTSELAPLLTVILTSSLVRLKIKALRPFGLSSSHLSTHSGRLEGRHPQATAKTNGCIIQQFPPLRPDS